MKEYLSQKQISFEDRDITTHPSTISELQKLGFMTTPVTGIDREPIVGFDVRKLEERWLSASKDNLAGHRQA